MAIGLGTFKDATGKEKEGSIVEDATTNHQDISELPKPDGVIRPDVEKKSGEGRPIGVRTLDTSQLKRVDGTSSVADKKRPAAQENKDAVTSQGLHRKEVKKKNTPIGTKDFHGPFQGGEKKKKKEGVPKGSKGATHRNEAIKLKRVAWVAS